ALWMARAPEYDAIVLDLMLPGLDGIEVCRRLRAEGVWAPILMLTARDALDDRIDGRRARQRGPPPAPRPRGPPGLARRRRDRALVEGVRAARDVHAPPGRGALA